MPASGFGFINLMAAAAVESPKVEQPKAYLADPSAFASAAPVVEAAAPVEEEEFSDDDMGFDMFGFFVAISRSK